MNQIHNQKGIRPPTAIMANKARAVVPQSMFRDVSSSTAESSDCRKAGFGMEIENEGLFLLVLPC